MTTTPQQPPPEATEQPPPSPWELTRDEARRLRRRYRRQGLPLVAIGATHTAGGLAAATSGAAALLPLGAGLGAAAGAYAYARRHTGQYWQRVYAAVAAVSSGAWQTTATVAG